ncbi:hypothetical protein FO440_07280 [Mucilaginibacter corticis]|uniref:Uncharacterized protein n=1 Tax=Mucilaginibacter corticis TaxID=2597670 RepID=A0A556MVK6_9SPHI|nr:hypothetical protein [Mucilaginibacter corticis]TSJ43974.1 hypothetical protein FO440_07280 [Mucilaginibacter corticis]
MEIEDLNKYIHPDANPKRSALQTLAWYLMFFTFWLFTISSGIALFIYFSGTDNKTINLSNVGFGMLIALASVCFSYFKLLDPTKYKKIHIDVQNSGELFLASAIAFIVSSALKYSWTVMAPGSFFSNWFSSVIRISYNVSFFVAEVVCIFGLAKLVDVLYFRAIALKAK